MSQTRISGPTSSNVDAALSNAIGAHGSEGDKEALDVVDKDKKAKGPVKGAEAQRVEKKPGEKEERVADKKSGFEALDLTKIGPGDGAKQQLAQLVVGIAATQTVVATGAEAAPDLSEARTLFAELVATLKKPEGKPGAAFGIDGLLQSPQTPVFVPAVLALPPVEATPPVALRFFGLEKAPARVDERKADPTIRSRVETVRHYQKLADRFLQKQSELAMSKPQQQLPPAAQKAIEQASAVVAEACAIARGKQAVVWEKTPALKGRTFEQRMRIRDTAKALDEASEDIEIPSPALVKLEQGGRLLTAGPAFDFANGDIESLAILVMMQGAKVETDITRDQLQGMAALNKQKEQLRNLQTQAKKNEAALSREIQGEFNALKAAGILHSTITLDQYKGWRECAYAPLQSTTMDDGSQSYALPAPQLTGPSPPNASDIPDWLKTGTVERAEDKEPDEKATGLTYGLPAQLVASVKRLFNAAKTEGQTFAEFLGTLGLMPVSDISDIEANMQALKDALERGPDALIGPYAPPEVEGSGPRAIEELGKQAVDIAKQEMLAAAFPNFVDEDKIDSKRYELEESLKKLTPQQRADYNAWLDDPAKGMKLVNEYKDKIQRTFNALNARNNENFDKVPAKEDGEGGLRRTHTGGGKDKWDQSRFNNVELRPGCKDDGSSDIPDWLAGNDGHNYNELEIHTADVKYRVQNGELQIYIDGTFTQYNIDGLVGIEAGNARWSFEAPFKDPEGILADIQEFDIVGGNRSEASLTTAGHDVKMPDEVSTAAYDSLSGAHLSADPVTDKGFQAWQKRTADATAAIAALKTKLGEMGKVTDEGSVHRTWARKNGFDTEYNEKQDAAKETQSKEAAAAALAKQAANTIFDPTTRLPLVNRGNLEMVGACMQEIKDKLDTLNGLTEVEQLRLQSQMDRRSKLFETLSNILKNISNTNSTIRGNIK